MEKSTEELPISTNSVSSFEERQLLIDILELAKMNCIHAIETLKMDNVLVESGEPYQLALSKLRMLAESPNEIIDLVAIHLFYQ